MPWDPLLEALPPMPWEPAVQGLADSTGFAPDHLRECLALRPSACKCKGHF